MEKTMDDVKQRVSENFDDVREELGERVQEIRDTVTNYVDAHPIASVGIAFGVGYLLSGALFSRATFKAASIGGRFALGGFLKQLVGGIGPGLIGAALGGRGEERAPGGDGSRGQTHQH
jgi:hypothetical protein